MGMDRNTVIGFILIGLLLVGMLTINSRNQKAAQEAAKLIADSTVAAQKKAEALNKPALKLDSLKSDTLKQIATARATTFATASTEVKNVLENDVIKITFTNKGAQPAEVILKKYKTAVATPLIIQAANKNSLGYAVNTAKGVISTNDVLFNTDAAITANSITYFLQDSAGNKIQHKYTLPVNDYLLGLEIIVNGAKQMFTDNTLNLTWKSQIPQAEKNLTYERQQTFINYNEAAGNIDFERIASGGSDKKFNDGAKWIATSAQFFSTAIVSANKFVSAAVAWSNPADSLGIVTQTDFTGKLALKDNTATVPLQFYYGPTDYNVLNKYNNELQKIVPYGNGPFSFVKYINRHFLLPVWDFIKTKVPNYGIVILLLTLIIRLITSPILYKSYLSGAKMKALKPEVDALRAKHTDAKTGEFNQQAFGMEQMKLWGSAGVSPLGGCLPALLQIPIFMSLYFFFQANIDLRGENFLWAKDLAAYDSIATLPFNIPFYGDHVSLFTLTATLTSLLISLYGMSNMQDNSNPMMKYMPYIFPILLLGVFNNLPAALTWYYTISNTITLLLQIVIQKFIINPDKIRTELAENMKKPKKQSKFAERMALIQEQQKKMQAAKKNN
jgi:YidC/Oxa1 family membrane protein insertase